MREALRGSEIAIQLQPRTVVDIEVLTRGTWTESIRVRGLGSELLEGMSFPSDPVFDAWLSMERSRIRSIEMSVLRGAAAACLGTGRPDMATDLASRALAIDRFDEGAHELLIRSLAVAGLREKAQLALDRCTQLFKEDLQVELSPTLKAAVNEDAAPRVASGSQGRSASAQLELGRSAINAGAIETGIESLRGAVWAAEQGSDEALLAECLLALAYSLIHSVRGRDGEASALLHHALGLAQANSMSRVAAECLRELGYVEMLVGSYDRAMASFDRALAMEAMDEGGRAWTIAYQALSYSDTGRYEKAVACLEACLASEAGEVVRQKAYALCLLGRIQMLRGQLQEARSSLEKSISLATGCGWTALLPWPRALLAEVELLQGAPLPGVRARLDHALSLARQIGDPCWEGAAMHGLGLVEAAAGRPDTAAACLADASTVCTRFPDSYLWMKAYVLDALCDLATRYPGGDPDRWITDLQNLSARSGMTEFLARSYLYRGRAGDQDALMVARMISREVDNPSLAALF